MHQIMKSTSLILLLAVFVIANDEKQSGIVVRIYSNFAEIIQPLRQELPLEFSDQEWTDIRADSITLLGANIIKQTITEKKKSLNGARIYVRWPSLCNGQLKEAIVVDETTRLVKINHENQSQFLFYRLTYDEQIVYVNEEPLTSKFYVDFTYEKTPSDRLVHLSYLRSSFFWITRYQLIIDEADETLPSLVAIADIRNNGKSAVSIQQAELVTGDINLQMPRTYSNPDRSFNHRNNEFDLSYTSHALAYSPQKSTISGQEELAGVYMFTIDKPFSIDSQTNYLVSMFRARVNVEQYTKISKSSYRIGSSSKGKTQRSYRLTSTDHFLPRGNCIIRHSNRLIGETQLPNIAANETYEFMLGEDPDIIYQENVTLLSTTAYKDNERDTQGRSQSVYEIDVHLTNFKKRSINIEYQHQFDNYYLTSLTLLQSSTLDKNKLTSSFTQEGLSIKGKMKLAAGENQVFSYEIEVIQKA